MSPWLPRGGFGARPPPPSSFAIGPIPSLLAAVPPMASHHASLIFKCALCSGFRSSDTRSTGAQPDATSRRDAAFSTLGPQCLERASKVEIFDYRELSARGLTTGHTGVTSPRVRMAARLRASSLHGAVRMPSALRLRLRLRERCEA